MVEGYDKIKHLIKRGYSRKILQRDANRVHAIPRHAALQSQEQKTTKAGRTLFVISFNPILPKISFVVTKHITILQSSINYKQAFPHPPVIAYKRNASLRDLLVHSELPENKPSHQQPTGIHLFICLFFLFIYVFNFDCTRDCI